MTTKEMYCTVTKDCLGVITNHTVREIKEFGFNVMLDNGPSKV